MEDDLNPEDFGLQRVAPIAERMIRGARPLPTNVGAALEPATSAHDEPETADLGELLAFQAQPDPDGQHVAIWLRGTNASVEVWCYYGEAIELAQAILQASKAATGGNAYPLAHAVPDLHGQEIPEHAGALRSVLVAPDNNRVIVYLRTADAYVLRVECLPAQAVTVCLRLKEGARPLASRLVDMTVPKMVAELELERDKARLAANLNPARSSKAP